MGACHVQLELNGIDLTMSWVTWNKKQFLARLVLAISGCIMPCSSPIMHCQDSKIEYGSCSRNTEWKRPQIATRNPFRLTNSKVSVNDSMLAATHVLERHMRKCMQFRGNCKGKKSCIVPGRWLLSNLSSSLESILCWTSTGNQALTPEVLSKLQTGGPIKVSLYIALWLCVLITGICVRWASWKLSAPMLVMLGFLQGTVPYRLWLLRDAWCFTLCYIDQAMAEWTLLAND